MALSGNLGFVPLDEVLRLLMRSDQRGSVEVRGEDIRGRVFVGKKGVSLATTSEDRDLHKHLVNSGYVDDTFLRKVVSGESTFSDLLDREASVIDLLREITIESLYHLGQKGATFEVAEGASSLYGSPRPFELEAVLDDARRRAEEWATVHEAIADLDSTIRMNRDPGDQAEIRINREAWRLLCELGSGASVKLMAERLGTTEFWIAKVAADMAEQQLLVLTGEWDEEPAADEPAAAAAPLAPVATEVDEDLNRSQSWWVEPQDEEPVAEVSETHEADEQSPDEPTSDEPTSDEPTSDEPTSDEPVKDSRFGHFVRSNRSEDAFAAPADDPLAPATEPEDRNDYSDAPSFEATPEFEGVEEDTEAFLEKVFSQLDVNGNVDVEDEGHGLLRRRRMGSVLKEIDED